MSSYYLADPMIFLTVLLLIHFGINYALSKTILYTPKKYNVFFKDPLVKTGITVLAALFALEYFHPRTILNTFDISKFAAEIFVFGYLFTSLTNTWRKWRKNRKKSLVYKYKINLTIINTREDLKRIENWNECMQKASSVCADEETKIALKCMVQNLVRSLEIDRTKSRLKINKNSDEKYTGQVFEQPSLTELENKFRELCSAILRKQENRILSQIEQSIKETEDRIINVHSAEDELEKQKFTLPPQSENNFCDQDTSEDDYEEEDDDDYDDDEKYAEDIYYYKNEEDEESESKPSIIISKKHVKIHAN